MQIPHPERGLLLVLGNRGQTFPFRAPGPTVVSGGSPHPQSAEVQEWESLREGTRESVQNTMPASGPLRLLGTSGSKEPLPTCLEGRALTTEGAEVHVGLQPGDQGVDVRIVELQALQEGDGPVLPSCPQQIQQVPLGREQSANRRWVGFPVRGEERGESLHTGESGAQGRGRATNPSGS